MARTDQLAGLTVGDPAPAFSLDSTAGGKVSLSDRLDSGPVVVLPFRGVWCSYCAEQLSTFSDLSYDLWRHFDMDVLPVTVDPVPDLVEMRDRFDLRLQLLSDPDLSVAEAYAGVEENDSHGSIPIPGVFVIDGDGVVRYAQVADNPSDRVYANFVRHVVKNDFEDPYAE